MDAPFPRVQESAYSKKAHDVENQHDTLSYREASRCEHIEQHTDASNGEGHQSAVPLSDV